MYSHSFLTTWGLGRGSEPTTAANSLDGWSGFIKNGFTFFAGATAPPFFSAEPVPPVFAPVFAVACFFAMRSPNIRCIPPHSSELGRATSRERGNLYV